jgi:hypothetical protein
MHHVLELKKIHPHPPATNVGFCLPLFPHRLQTTMTRLTLFSLSAFFLLAWSNLMSAQGTLQFNRVLMVGNVEQTVPAGKVWKVESIMYSSAPTPIMGGNQNDQLLIDGSALTVRATRSSNGGYNAVTYGVWEQKLPIWLPAASRLQTGANVQSVSVIEFNILP